jgi:hypothetical protein
MNRNNYITIININNVYVLVIIFEKYKYLKVLFLLKKCGAEGLTLLAGVVVVRTRAFRKSAAVLFNVVLQIW